MGTSGTGGVHFFNIIRTNYVQLQKDLDVTKIVPYFFQDNLLELHDIDEINNCKLQRDKADCFLLKKCVNMNQAKAFETFIYALRELNFDHILEMFKVIRKNSSESTLSTTQTETCDKRDVEVQTDLTCSWDNSSPSSYFICLNCRRDSFSNPEYDDGTSLERPAEDEGGYTLLLPGDKPLQSTKAEAQQKKTISGGAVPASDSSNTTGRIRLTHTMSDPSTYTSPVSNYMNYTDLKELEEVSKLEGWRPDVNESNVKDKARAWEGKQGQYFLWICKRSKKDSKKRLSSKSRNGRIIVSVWSKTGLLHYKILDKKDENGQKTYFVDKSFFCSSISELIETWKNDAVSFKQDIL